MLRKYIAKLVSKCEDDWMQEHHFYPIDYCESQDIFIVGYPKSGNTWLQHQLASLIFQIKADGLSDRLVQELIPKIGYKKFYKRFLDWTCFSTHALPESRFKKVIYLVRDGRDAMVSYFHMNKNLDIDISLEEMILEGKGLHTGKWHKHIEKWLENPYDAQILFVRYEDMLQQPVQELQRICDFLKLERKKEELLAVATGSSFKKMSEKEDTQGWDNKAWKTDRKFIRKGRAGNYLEEMPEHLQAYFEEEAKQALIHFNYL
ncbi:MAG: sulfotransferase domain-containing protein [Bacteroidota bacterium]